MVNNKGEVNTEERSDSQKGISMQDYTHEELRQMILTEYFGGSDRTGDPVKTMQQVVEKLGISATYVQRVCRAARKPIMPQFTRD